MSLVYGVVIPAHNAERTLGEAIESVLSQTVTPAEVIVVDDGSDDATGRIAASFEAVEVIRQPRGGPAAATDRGLDRLTSPLVAGLDADDVWFPEKAAAQLTVLLDRPALDGVFCRAVAFAHGSPPDRRAGSHPLWGRSAMMLRRQAVARIGPVLRADIPVSGEMIDWLARGRELGLRFDLIPDTLVGRRRTPGSLMDGQNAAAALMPVVRAALQRRRQRAA